MSLQEDVGIHLPGLERLRLIQSRGLRSPYAGLLDMRLVDADDGRVVVESAVVESVMNTSGTAHGGFIATVAARDHQRAKVRIGVELRRRTAPQDLDGWAHIREPPLGLDGKSEIDIRRLVEKRTELLGWAGHAVTIDRDGHGESRPLHPVIESVRPVNPRVHLRGDHDDATISLRR